MLCPFLQTSNLRLDKNKYFCENGQNWKPGLTHAEEMEFSCLAVLDPPPRRRSH